MVQKRGGFAQQACLTLSFSWFILSFVGYRIFAHVFDGCFFKRVSGCEACKL